jgi:hypothetical protein
VPTPRPTSQRIVASRVTPQECVLVMVMGVCSSPDSSIYTTPVISPLPLRE